MNKNSPHKFKRKYNTRKQYKFVYIFTEGTKTEVNYFMDKKREIEGKIRRKNIKIEVGGTGYNTTSLVDFVINYIEKNDVDAKYDDCWVVFDKDSFDRTFNMAIKRATDKKLKVAYSNESFELWYLLHFNFLTSAIARSDYISRLTNGLKKHTGNKKIKYHKEATYMYSLIKTMEGSAIKNAKKLLKIHENEKSFSKKNPSTTVHLLIESLNKLK
ncbi:MAG: RloB family protein [Patescibacteria group bacterium]|nr:RloB family protein [Patescibacteria group bacterium]